MTYGVKVERMWNSCKEGFRIVARILIATIFVPLLIFLYLLWWLRVKVTALIYSNRNQSLVASEDVTPFYDVNLPNSIINVVHLITGHFPLDAMKELFLSQVLDAKDARNKPLFPKFTRYVHLCAGYLMWSEESNFNIDDHIRPYHGQPPNDEEQLKSLITDACNEPFPSRKSGWEIIVIPLKYSQSDVPQTCILFRVHHFFADGISILRLIIEQMAGNHGAFQHVLKRMETKFKPQFKNAFLNMLVNFGDIIYSYIFKQFDIYKLFQDNQVIIKSESAGCSFNYVDWTSDIKMSTITCIRSVTSTTVNDVLMSCLAGALRKYFVKRDMYPPECLHTAVAINYQGADDPVEMKNKVFGVMSQMLTGDMDCLQRLKTTKVVMDQMKRSPDMILDRWLTQHWFNIIPYRIMKRWADSIAIDVVYSNMPGPTNKASFDGHTIESMFPMQLNSHSIGIGVWIFSYAENVTVSITVDRAIISQREELRSLLKDIVEEMQQLYNAAIGIIDAQAPLTKSEKKLN